MWRSICRRPTNVCTIGTNGGPYLCTIGTNGGPYVRMYYSY